jgi:hypothetical protein
LGHVNEAPISAALKKQSSAEARFLRAWYYVILIKNFGGVPLLDDKLFGASDDLQLPRNTYEECVNYIVKELDQSAAELPVGAPCTKLWQDNKGSLPGVKI